MTNPQGANLNLGLLLRQSHQRAAKSLNNALTPLSLTGRHFGVMLLLQREGTSTQRDLIGLTGSDKAGMTRTVEDLERLGYLRRTQSTSDKRVADLTLTHKGVQAFDEARRLAFTAAEQLFSEFTPAELTNLEHLLARFVSAQMREPERPSRD